MKSTVLTCDRCGAKESDEQAHRWLKVERPIVGAGESHEVDLCRGCVGLFFEWVKAGRK